MLVPVLLFLGGAVFTAALAAYLATQSDVGPWFAVATVLAGAGWLLSQRAVRARIPALRTFPMQLRALYQRAWDLRRELKSNRYPERSWDDYKPRFSAWDKELWKLLGEHIPDEVPVHQRALPQVESLNDTVRWNNDAMRLLEARLALVAQLLTRR